ncbi:MAG: vitamin K epoxide reductase family protein [Candidatus Niyogibacteria bacterium]|nr:vitamin K epoxide reductase family protein [Candidatus Niyogibacteria bacterium]
MKKWLPILIMIIAAIGLIDSGYLTWGYYSGAQLKCTIFEGCNTVLTSGYSALFGNIPNALLGMIYYGFILFLLTVYLVERVYPVKSAEGGAEQFNGARIALQAATALVAVGVLFSAYFVYLQLYVIGAICIYCMVSAADTALLTILLPVLSRYDKLNSSRS